MSLMSNKWQFWLFKTIKFDLPDDLDDRPNALTDLFNILESRLQKKQKRIEMLINNLSASQHFE